MQFNILEFTIGKFIFMLKDHGKFMAISIIYKMI